MMDLVAGLMHGFAALLSPLTLTACLLGLLAGLIAGFLPGLSPAGAVALGLALTPLVGTLGLESPLVFIVALSYGTLYGRALAAINSDATAGAARLAPSDRPALVALILVGIGAALGAALVVAVGGPQPQRFGPAELSAFIVFLLLGGAAFSRGSVASAFAMVVFGLLLRLVGTDIETGVPRLTFGIPALENGFSLIELALGLFVIANVIDDLVRARKREPNGAMPAAPPRRLVPAIILAALAGFLPTNGETFAATASARRAEGSADLFDPASQGSVAGSVRAALLSDIRFSVSLIVLFLLLMPVDPMTALLRGAVYLQAFLTNSVANLVPLASLAAATLVLAHIVPIAIVGCMTRVAWRPIRIPVTVVAPLLAVAACLAVWWLSDSNPSAVIITLLFGLIGYLLIRGGFDRSLLFFAFAVGGPIEENIRRALLIARGDLTTYLQRPIAAVLLVSAVLVLVVARRWRRSSQASPVGTGARREP